MASKKTSNSARVPKRQWAKWSENAKFVFNELYYTMAYNKTNFMHPGQDAPRDEYWETTCWNAAWEAAEAVNQIKE